MNGPTPHLHNPSTSGGASCPSEVRALLGGEHPAEAERVITAWPGYHPTPLRSAPGLAAMLGLAEVWCKDESGRFGLGSFKALGGAYAVYRLLDAHPPPAAGLSVCAASAGNHGRSVAWAARLFGCPCTIYLPSGTDAARVRSIEALGADVVRVTGTYDETVRRAAADAADRGWTLISDTSDRLDAVVPLTVMRGYTVLAREIVRQWEGREPPTHVVLQCGVGGLAAAVCAHLWERWGSARPRVIVTEPESAACMLESARAGLPSAVGGPLDTVMTCLACGEPSAPAWEVLRRGADDFVAVSDALAREAVELLGLPASLEPPIRTAPSGAAGLAALLAAAREPALTRDLGLGPGSRVLLIVSEGAQE